LLKPFVLGRALPQITGTVGHFRSGSGDLGLPHVEAVGVVVTALR
jgi:hypothetical protein